MLSRRDFVAAAALASGTALLPKTAFAAEKADVIIIGAGLSGMNAALLLKEQGLRVVVLEASNIVGGRVRTHDTVDGPIDVGASQVGRSYARIIALCAKFGLALVPEDRSLLKFGTHFKGSWIDSESWASNPLNQCVGEERSIPPLVVASRLVSKYNPLANPDDWLDPKFAAQDISLRQLLQQHGHSAQAIELAALFPPGISIDDTSVLRMWQEETRGTLDRQFGSEAPVASNKVQPYGEESGHKLVNGLAPTSNITGGCHALPAAMGASLGDLIRLNKRVTRIDMTKTEGTVQCADGSSFGARFIISAIPFTMLRKVAITPGSSAPAAQAIAQMPYANTARAYLSVEPFWLDDGLPPSFASDAPMGMFWAIDNHKGTGAHRAMIVMTGPPATQISKLEPAAAEAMLLGQLAELRPASVGKVRLQTMKDWARDPLAEGCGFSMAPGQVSRFGRDMIKPWNVMHFAGEHTRRNDFGMEAAAESGERAALEVILRAG